MFQQTISLVVLTDNHETLTETFRQIVTKVARSGDLKNPQGV
jgi:hypothetical protein